MRAREVGAIAVVVLLVTASFGGSARATSSSATRRPARAVSNAAAVHHPDFNHDGYADLVVPAQGDTVSGVDFAGGVWVLYGGAHGANTGNHHQYFTESSIGRGASSALNDNFGSTYATGDFNGDGYDDLAVGVVEKSVGGNAHAGAVVVLYGSGFGLITGNAQFFTEATSGMNAAPQPNEYFGNKLAAADFNHDGRADLAIDASGETVGSASSAGVVFELFGTAHGLSHAAPLLPKKFSEATPGLHGGAKPNDRFGIALNSGDFDGDGFPDLVAGAASKSVDGASSAGAVYVLRGSASGLTGTGAQTWTEDTAGVPDTSEMNDNWGSAFAVLDINGDGRSDLVIGAPGESQGATASVGAATVLMAGAHGLTTSGARFYLLSNTTVGQTPAANDVFASAFAPFDFDGDGRTDLAIGAQGRQIGSATHAGEVVVLHNVGGVLSRSGGFTFSRSTPGMIGPAGQDEGFSALIHGGDWSGNGHDDLAVSVPNLTVSGVLDAGAMQVFYGTSSGLATNDQLFTANALGGTPYTDASMGGFDY